MNISVDRSFEKDTDKLHDKKLLLKIAECLKHVMDCKQLSDIQNLKKLQGFKNFYRIRMGNYRIGLRVENDTLIFERFLHRNDIYKYYPK